MVCPRWRFKVGILDVEEQASTNLSSQMIGTEFDSGPGARALKDGVDPIRLSKGPGQGCPMQPHDRGPICDTILLEG